MVQWDLFKDILEKLEEKPILIEDQLSFIDEASELADDIFKSKSKPYVLAIWGEWGTGKTSFMQILRSFLDISYYEEAVDILSEEKEKIWSGEDIYEIRKKEKIYAEHDEQLSIKPCKTIWFRAWEEEFRQDSWKKKTWESLFGQILREIHEDTDIHKSLKKDNKQYRLFESLYKAGLSFLKNYNDRPDFKEATFKGVMDFLKNFFLSSDTTTSIQSIDKNASLQTFRKRFDEISQSELFPYEKIVVFIDDLDRCDPVEAFRIVKSLKAFFETEKLVFVFGVEKKMLETGFEMEKEKMFGSKTEDRISFDRYVEKIISEEKEMDISYRNDYFNSDKLDRLVSNMNDLIINNFIRLTKYWDSLYNAEMSEISNLLKRVIILWSWNNLRRIKKIYRIFIRELIKFLSEEDITLKDWSNLQRIFAVCDSEFIFPNILYAVFAADSKNCDLKQAFQERYNFFVQLSQWSITPEQKFAFFAKNSEKEKYVMSLLSIKELPEFQVLFFMKIPWLRNFKYMYTEWKRNSQIENEIKHFLNWKSEFSNIDFLNSLHRDLMNLEIQRKEWMWGKLVERLCYVIRYSSSSFDSDFIEALYNDFRSHPVINLIRENYTNDSKFLWKGLKEIFQLLDFIDSTSTSITSIEHRKIWFLFDERIDIQNILSYIENWILYWSLSWVDGSVGVFKLVRDFIITGVLVVGVNNEKEAAYISFFQKLAVWLKELNEKLCNSHHSDLELRKKCYKEIIDIFVFISLVDSIFKINLSQFSDTAYSLLKIFEWLFYSDDLKFEKEWKLEKILELHIQWKNITSTPGFSMEYIGIQPLIDFLIALRDNDINYKKFELHEKFGGHISLIDEFFWKALFSFVKSLENKESLSDILKKDLIREILEKDRSELERNTFRALDEVFSNTVFKEKFWDELDKYWMNISRS